MMPAELAKALIIFAGLALFYVATELLEAILR